MRRVVLAAALVVLGPAAVGAQISPGPLARPHQALEGPTKCVSCHGRSADAMPRLCLACHREIRWLVSAKRGLHANPVAMAGRNCGSCHPDHAGRDFALIEWPAGGTERFDHAAAGWRLEGQHRDVACDDCHQPEFRNGPAAVLSPRTRGAGWTGLETSCVSCHRRDDQHGNALGTDCARCHAADDWAPAPGFDHADSRYPLTGAHREVDCATCHLAPSLGIAPGPDGARVAKYRPIPFGDCASCHADPHRGRLPGDCAACHVTRGFDVIESRGFNHAATRYPLLGKHRSTGCEACHGRAMATPRPGFARCSTCHADVHGGEATRADTLLDCAACHREQGFLPATFTVAQHQETAFALEGRHARVPCARCHVPSRSTPTGATLVPLRPVAEGCASCHADPHAGQVDDRPCASCHGDDGWAAVRYDARDHAGTRLPLEGAHATIDCARCHGPDRPGLPALPATAGAGSAGIVFRIAEVRCASCHGDPHPTTADSVDCASCHGSAAFRPARVGVAEHGAFTFVLDGAHRAVPCVDCHAGLGGAGVTWGAGGTLIGAAAALPAVELHATDGTTCAACHDTPHGAQFATRADSGACESCHVTETFVGTLVFDHDRGSAFPLAGAHAAVRCASCHPSDATREGPRTRYRPVAHRCEDCHAGRPGERES